MSTFPSKPPKQSSVQPASTPTSTKTVTGSSPHVSISSSPDQPRPFPDQDRSNPRTPSKQRMKFRNAAPNLAPRVPAGAELLLGNKIAFAAPQLLPAVPVLTATVGLQKKGQVNEYKGESKFLTATKRRFSQKRKARFFALLPCLRVSLPPPSSPPCLLASVPLPYYGAARRTFAVTTESHPGRQLHGN